MKPGILAGVTSDEARYFGWNGAWYKMSAFCNLTVTHLTSNIHVVATVVSVHHWGGWMICHFSNI